MLLAAAGQCSATALPIQLDHGHAALAVCVALLCMTSAGLKPQALAHSKHRAIRLEVAPAQLAMQAGAQQVALAHLEAQLSLGKHRKPVLKAIHKVDLSPCCTP